jgi:hypothetical protein
MASDGRKPTVNNEATGREFCRVQDRSFEIWHAQELACWWGGISKWFFRPFNFFRHSLLVLV